MVQFSHGQNDDNVSGDPMMVTIPASIYYTNKFLFSTIHYPNYAHYVNIIVLAQYYQPDMIYLISEGVNKSLDTQEWVPVKVNNVTEAYAAMVNVTEGVVEIIHTNTSALMTAIVYGFARYLGYGHPGGSYIQRPRTIRKCIVCNCSYRCICNNMDLLVVVPLSVNIVASGNQTVGQPLTLECTVIEFDRDCVNEFAWSNGGVQLREIKGTDFCHKSGKSAVCTDTFNISILSTSDDGAVGAYQCDVTTHHDPPVTATSSITLNLNGMTN